MKANATQCAATIDASFFQKTSVKGSKEFWARCAILSEIALLASDRTTAGEKETPSGVQYTDCRLQELGFGNAKRIQFAGAQMTAIVAGKPKQITPTIEFLGAYNDTDIVCAFRPTHNKAGWAINFRSDSTRTEIGDVHQGWFEDVEAVMPQVTEWLSSIPGVRSKRLWVCGHSKGSAEGQIFAALIDKTYPVEMFLGIGSPRPFKAATAKKIAEQFKGRMFWTKNNNDLVCITPPKFLGYDACGEMVYISADGKVSFGPPLIKQFFDGIFGFIKGAPNVFEGEYPDQGEDHFPHYYTNAFYAAAGSDRKIARWLQKFMD